ncbi:MAG: sodium-dependent transporter [Planctomycetaceae bacterium]|nr:sodium-dependent transporter [Planctomycetaceae bacterium]
MAQADGSREVWGSRVGIIMAVMGSAVGLGNFLRFPGQAAQYGGGAFMIPYFIAFLLLGLPIAWVEWSMGRFGGSRGFNSSPGIFRAVWPNRFSPYLGVLSLVVPVGIYMYYVYVEAWCLAYAVRYLVGQMDFGTAPAAYQKFFGDFVGITGNGDALMIEGEGILGSAVFFLALCFCINFVLIYRGLTKGIEWCCTWAMPLLVVCAMIVLGRVLTLGTPDAAKPDQNLLNGLGCIWNPSTAKASLWESLAKPEVWLAAAGQIFFSLSVGQGIMATYASYLRRDDDIALSSLTAAAGNEFCEVVLGGMITIPAAFVFLGYGFVQNPPGTFGMGFVALPNVFNQMVAGPFFGFLFFLLLFLAALTSSLSMLQPAIALLEEGLGLKRKASVAMLGFITAVGSAFVVFFSKDLKAMDTFDFWIGTFAIFVLATIEVFLFTFGMGVDRGFDELNRGAEIRIPRIFKFIIKYVSPVYLLTIFCCWCYKEFFNTETATRWAEIQSSQVVRFSLGFIVLMGVFFAILIGQSAKRWKAADRVNPEVIP